MQAEVVQADVVIVGGGMVGSLLAAALQPLQLQVVVIDVATVTPPPDDAPFEPRVSAISLATENMLRHVGAWQLLQAHRHCPYTAMEVRESLGNAQLRFQAADVGSTHLGCLVENRLLQWALTCAAQQGGARYLAPARVSGVQRLLRGWRVQLADGTVLDTPLLIGADGAFSLVRQAAALSISTWDYQQQAIVCTVRTERPHQACARQIFLPSGPLALLPLSQPDQCSIVWSATTARAAELLALSEADFCVALQQAFGQELGAILSADRRHAFPLVARHAERYTLEGLALIGDAAHTVHPLAGQGVNLGFLDAAVLAEEMARAVRRGLPHYHREALDRYSRRRRPHNHLIMHSMTGLERVYAAAWPLGILLRNEGVRLVDSQLPLKRFFEKQAMGLQGDLPALAQSGPAATAVHRQTA